LSGSVVFSACMGVLDAPACGEVLWQNLLFRAKLFVPPLSSLLDGISAYSWAPWQRCPPPHRSGRAVVDYVNHLRGEWGIATGRVVDQRAHAGAGPQGPVPGAASPL